MRMILLAALACAGPAAAQPQTPPCGGPFDAFVAGLADEARTQGHDEETVRRFFAGVRQDPKVLRADRAQGVFQMPFVDFARRLISRNRIDTGLRKGQEQRQILDRIEAELGVPRGILLAFWGFETDYGTYQGDYNTRDALVTLAHDCRRPELFRPQVLAALELFARGDFDPAGTTGAWAGEVGMVQMLPRDILKHGSDGDGDGHVRLKSSAPDALLSGARMLRALGWRPNEPWLQEVRLRDGFDWSLTGLETPRTMAEWARLGVEPRGDALGPDELMASVLLPQGRNGPAFLAYPNFNVLFEWNKSFVYVTTAAYFATRLEGAPVFDAGTPDDGLNQTQMKALQTKLAQRGYDVGAVDGILGANTRAAIRDVQRQLGLPADAWPTPDLLNRL